MQCCNCGYITDKAEDGQVCPVCGIGEIREVQFINDLFCGWFGNVSYLVWKHIFNEEKDHLDGG